MAKEGGGGDGNKVEELHPHPVMEQLAGVQYCINSPPPWLEAVLLGFQHYLLTLGTTVLIPSVTVPQMGGGDVEKAKVIQTLLFLSGLNTLFQSFFGTRLPSVICGSYAFLIPTMSIIQARRSKMLQEPDYERFVQTIRAIQGGLIIASCFQTILGFLGLWRNVVRFLSPLSIVPLVSFTGLGLYYLGFPMYLPPYVQSKRPICDRFGMLFSVAIIWVYSEILTWSGAYRKSTADALSSCRTDRAGLIGGAPWIYIPYPFQWGTFLATSRYGSATPVPPSVVSRGVGWLGFGTFLSGIFGCVTGSTASVENAGLLALTRVGSRSVIQISAGFMIFFSLLGKFGAIFASIPLPIVAALYCILFGCVCTWQNNNLHPVTLYAASAGLGHLQFCNLNSFRTKFILGCSFSLGLSLPQYFREHQLISSSSTVHTHSTWFNDMVSVIFMSHATVAGGIALLLDRTLPRGNDEHRKDSGSHWWAKFVVYKADVRSDEFYKLPCKLNKLFPPL
ncbi:hypothetical protein RJ640_006863 [Escallonia rubra]|uniref:Nucleobase-ascorbate transporter 10 n=1 Tax=Escallonia rubra TaxID=112253 RepID=A0AA88SB02_9ASTE|nr:hypothetical protein RJ640_006863 [Escallonia rubra]